MRLWAVLLALFLCGMQAQARTVLDLDTKRQPVPLLDWGDAWMDMQAQATAAQVAADRTIAWEPTRAHAVYPLGPGRALWIRFTLPPAPDAERWYLEIPYPSINRVSLYTTDGAGRWVAQEAGDVFPVASWPVPHRHPLLPLIVSAEEPRAYLLRVENHNSFGAALNFINESHLSRAEQRTSLVLGIYFGLAGLAMTLALLSAVSLRDQAYGYYAVTVLLMALTQASMTGIAGLHLWPRWPWWNDVSAMLLPTLTMASLLWFHAAAVSLPERSPRVYRLVAGMSMLGVAVALAGLLAEPSLRLRLLIVYVIVAAPITVTALVWAWRRGDRYALWLLAAVVPVLLGAAFPLTRVMGLTTVSFWSLHAMQIGIAIELPTVLVVLMLRSQQRREHNRRIQGLDRVDPATGLINAHVFTERLQRMMGRSQRLRHNSAVLLVDIVNIEQITREFDRREAQELPLRVAGRLLGAAREIDSVARLADTRFGILVEGPLTAEEAASVGPRVVARCLMPFKNKPLSWVAQVRVAQTLVPSGSNDAALVIERLGALLAAVPADSKRAVFPMK